MTLIERVRVSVAQDPAASLCVRCILVRDSRRTLVATMVRMVQLAEARGSVRAPGQSLDPTRRRSVNMHSTVPATLRASTHVAEGA